MLCRVLPQPDPQTVGLSQGVKLGYGTLTALCLFCLLCRDQYKDTVRACRAGVRKTKAHLEVSLARYVKGNKRDFQKFISSKRMTRENMLGDFGTKDMEKAQVFDAFFYLSFCWKDQLSGIPGT